MTIEEDEVEFLMGTDLEPLDQDEANDVEVSDKL